MGVPGLLSSLANVANHMHYMTVVEHLERTKQVGTPVVVLVDGHCVLHEVGAQNAQAVLSNDISG
jgi:hypothetical protein